MFDFGWPELLLIAAIGVLVIGPDEIPAIMRMLGRAVRRLQYIRFAVSRQFDDFLEEQDLKDLQKEASARETGDAGTEKAGDEMMPLPPGTEAEPVPDVENKPDEVQPDGNLPPPLPPARGED